MSNTLSLVFLLFTISLATGLPTIYHKPEFEKYKRGVNIINIQRPNNNEHYLQYEVDNIIYEYKLLASTRQVFNASKTPLWLATTSPLNPAKQTYFYKGKCNLKAFGFIYVDYEQGATFLIHYDNQKQLWTYDGVIGSKLNKVIVRLTDSDANGGRLKRSTDNFVYKFSPGDDSYDSITNAEKVLENGNGFIPKLDKPLPALYPKVAAIVDHSLFELFDKNVNETLKYLYLYWSIVDLHFAAFRDPSVQIMVTAVVVADTEKALEFVYKSRDATNSKYVINLRSFVPNTYDYFSRKFSLEMNFTNYDAAAVMTALPLLVDKYQLAYGFANSIGKICRRGGNVYIASDNSKYSMVETSVHELGHLLNMFHDEEGSSLTACKPLQVSVNNIAFQSTMAAEYFLPNKWSDCSQLSLAKLASYEAGSCLTNSERYD